MTRNSRLAALTAHQLTRSVGQINCVAGGTYRPRFASNRELPCQTVRGDGAVKISSSII